MDAAGLKKHATAVLKAFAKNEPGSLVGAFGYLLAMARDRDSPMEARWHVLYFATSYVGAVQGGRDSTAQESREVNALSDDEIAEVCTYVAEHPLYAKTRHKLEAPDRLDMVHAFILTLVGMIFDADGVLRAEEQEFWNELLRQPDLTTRGLVEDGDVTPKFEDAQRAAMLVLGPMLLPADKLMIVETLTQACACDGDVDPREIETMVKGLEMLNVSRQETFELLRELRDRAAARGV